jgi:hypothetical protein
MTKQATKTAAAGHKAAKEARQPSKATVTKVQAPQAQPEAPQAPAAKPVALRGGPAVQAVKLTGKAYRTGADHNAQWWASIVQRVPADGSLPVADVLAAGVPAPFVGYCIRRGYLTVA